MSEATVEVGMRGCAPADNAAAKKIPSEVAEAAAEEISHAKGSGWKGQNFAKVAFGFVVLLLHTKQKAKRRTKEKVLHARSFTK